MNEPSRNVVVSIPEGANAEQAVDHVIRIYRERPMAIYLLCVRQPLPQYVARFISKSERDAHHQESGMLALRQARERLDACGIPHRDFVRVGQKAQVTVEFARENHCGQIIVAKPAGGGLSGLVLGSIGGQMRRLIGAGEPYVISEVF